MDKRQLLAAIAGLAALSLAPARADPLLPRKFEEGRDAAADLQHALSLAQAQRKLVLVDVGGEWCAWCHILDRFIASQPEVQQALSAQYVWLKVNFSPKDRNEALLSRWPKPRGYPHLYVLAADGRLLASQASSELESGRSYDAGKFLAFLRRQRPPA